MRSAGDYRLRPVSPSDRDFLSEILAFSAYSSLEGVLVDHKLSRYLQNWMSAEDFGVVAVDRSDNLLGGAFVRLFDTSTAPYHFIECAPYELVIAVKPEFRAIGLGRQILHEVVHMADNRRIALSLNVREGNPAVSFYLTVGFYIFDRIRNRAGSTSLVMIRECKTD